MKDNSDKYLLYVCPVKSQAGKSPQVISSSHKGLQ